MKRLLVAAVLLFVSVALRDAGPVVTRPLNWFAPVGAGASAPRSGFLLPTLAGTATGAAPRLIATEYALRGAVPVRVTSAAGQTQAPAKPPKSWWGRNWLRVVVPVAILAGLAIAVCTGWEAQCD